MSEIKLIGNNGVEFGPGYKGKGMCAACLYRSAEIANRPGNWLCGYYGSSCKQVSRNCSGIKSFIIRTDLSPGAVVDTDKNSKK